VRGSLWDLLTQIGGRAAQNLLGQLSLMGALSYLLPELLKIYITKLLKFFVQIVIIHPLLVYTLKAIIMRSMTKYQ
jgi:hypothetical protein